MKGFIIALCLFLVVFNIGYKDNYTSYQNGIEFEENISVYLSGLEKLSNIIDDIVNGFFHLLGLDGVVTGGIPGIGDYHDDCQPSADGTFDYYLFTSHACYTNNKCGWYSSLNGVLFNGTSGHWETIGSAM